MFASNGMPAEMLDRGMGSVLTSANVSPTTRVHPTEKPVDLLARLIKAVPGDDVFDPFMGSGSTGVAAIRAGRRFIGCEINPDHFATACKRIGEAVALLRCGRAFVSWPIRRVMILTGPYSRCWKILTDWLSVSLLPYPRIERHGD